MDDDHGMNVKPILTNEKVETPSCRSAIEQIEERLVDEEINQAYENDNSKFAQDMANGTLSDMDIMAISTPLSGSKHELAPSERAFWCYQCVPPAKITRAWNLKRHIMTKHKGAKQWMCGLCGQGYASRLSIQQHAYAAHRLSGPEYPPGVFVHQSMSGDTALNEAIERGNGCYDPAVGTTSTTDTSVDDVGATLRLYPITAAVESVRDSSSPGAPLIVFSETPTTSKSNCKEADSDSRSEASDVDQDGTDRVLSAKAEIHRLKYKKAQYKALYQKVQSKCLRLEAQLEAREPSCDETIRRAEYETKVLNLQTETKQMTEYARDKKRDNMRLAAQNVKLRQANDEFTKWLQNAPVQLFS